MKRLILFLAAGIIAVSSVFLPFTAQASTSITFNKGIGQSWTVPAGVTSITIDAAGAQGGYSAGGKGARIQASYAVTPGSVLYISVGGEDGTNGGGVGNNGGYPGNGGGYGGGHTWLSLVSSYDHSSNLILDAGGGGGDSNTGYGSATGGIGGITNGSAGSGGGGGGGTQSSGGNGYSGGSNGGSGTGGNGGVAGVNSGGGGGGGYFGGGGGGINSGYGGGGGGSSFTNASLSNITTTAGYQTGDGYLTITYTGSAKKHNVILISLNWKPEPIV